MRKSFVVNKKKGDLLEVIGSHHVNNGLYSRKSVYENLDYIRRELLPENMEPE